jgi:SNF2 family DNA or RNA helicase
MKVNGVNGTNHSHPNDSSGPAFLHNGDAPGPVSIAPSTISRENSFNGKRAIENLYGVESRSDQPKKKVKSPQDETERDSRAKSQKFSSSGTGIIGDYMKRRDDPNYQNRPTLLPPVDAKDERVVDLTSEIDNNDGDDFMITGSSTKEKEVCFGAIYTDAMAFLVPKPRKNKGASFLQQGQWPPMRCSLGRGTEEAKTTIIKVIDPSNKEFAKITAHGAAGLATLMDSIATLRTQPRLLNRPRRKDEQEHAPCSQTMKLAVNLYGQRRDAEPVGRILGQLNIWLNDVSKDLRDPGTELLNPHKMISHKAPARGKPVTRVVNQKSVVEAGSEEAMDRAVEKIFDHFANENIEETDAPHGILTPLLPHQKQALTFMLRHESPPDYEDDTSSKLWSKKYSKTGIYYQEAVCNLTINEPPPVSLGGLLADVMGLGKTLESLTLIAATTDKAEAFSKTQVQRGPENPDRQISANSKATLIVCPMSTVANWESQIKEHLEPSFTWVTHHGSNRTKNPYDLRKYDIVITTYGTLQSETRNGFGGVLRSIKWFRVILDEAHTIRESSALQSQACFELEADRRWCLTGTPIQNKLADLGSLCQFLRLYPYDSVAEFSLYIVKRAGSGDSTFLKRLRVFIDSFTLRRERDKINLPPKEDLQVAVEFSDAESKLHEFFRGRSEIILADLKKQRDEGKKHNMQISVLQGITILRLICAHGRELLREDDLETYKGGAPEDAIELDDEEDVKSMTPLQAYELFRMMDDADYDVCRNCDSAIAASTPAADGDTDSGPRCYILPCRDLLCAPCFRQYKSDYDDKPDDQSIQCALCHGITTATYVAIEGNVNDRIETMQANQPQSKNKDRYGGPASKTLALLEDIHQMTLESKPLEDAGEPPLKCVVFSEFTSHLSLISRALEAKGYRTARIDGSMSLSKRKKVLEALATDDSLTILLASIKAAGQGLNLTAASRAFIMEPLWNPAAEAQAVDRIYRIGQTRPVVVKRYHMKASIEESIMQLAEKKQKLADLSMGKNHKALSKKEMREQHYNEIRQLFESKKR